MFLHPLSGMGLYGWSINNLNRQFGWAQRKKISYIQRYVLIINSRMRAGAKASKEETAQSASLVLTVVYAYNDRYMDWAHLEMFQKYDNKPG